jgi:hypothetical protein
MTQPASTDLWGNAGFGRFSILGEILCGFKWLRRKFYPPPMAGIPGKTETSGRKISGRTMT